eukprot:COSAG02_NODE_754_length_17578_cov_97.544825_8_plen_109_part_00
MGQTRGIGTEGNNANAKLHRVSHRAAAGISMHRIESVRILHDEHELLIRTNSPLSEFRRSPARPHERRGHTARPAGSSLAFVLSWAAAAAAAAAASQDGNQREPESVG